MKETKVDVWMGGNFQKQTQTNKLRKTIKESPENIEIEKKEKKRKKKRFFINCLPTLRKTIRNGNRL